MDDLPKKHLKPVESKNLSVKVESLYAKTNKPKEFVNKLEQLCRKYCDRDNFFFKYSIED